MHGLFRSILSATLITVLLGMDCRTVLAEKVTLESKYLQITFNSSEDIARFNKSIDFDTGSFSGGFFSSETPTELSGKLTRKLDLLFEKVQRILDMRKPLENKIRVVVHSSEEELAATFVKIFKKQGSARGWYVFEYNTIYLNAQDVHEGMLAHELAHAVIDTYMNVRPPRATAEILATYVDKHLFEEVKTY